MTTHPGSFSANISCHCGHQGADKYAVSAVRGNYGHNDQPRVQMSVTSLMSLYSGSQWAGCGGCRPLIGQSRSSDWLVSVSVYSGWMGWTDNPSHYRPHSKIRSPELRDTSPDILTVSPRLLRLQLATAGADTEEHLGHLSSSPNGHPPSSAHTSLSNLPIFFSFLLLVSC